MAAAGRPPRRAAGSRLPSCTAPRRLNNCIGFFNHKFFVLFIFYMATLTIFMVVVMTPVFVRHVSSLEQVTLDFKVRFPLSEGARMGWDARQGTE